MNQITEYLDRFCQVLDELEIEYKKEREYVSILSSEKMETVVFMGEVKPYVIGRGKDIYYIHLDEKGKLTTCGHRTITIKYCKNCRKFYIGETVPRKEEICEVCGEKQFVFLTRNGKIPGWNGEETSSLYNPEEAEKALTSLGGSRENHVREILNRLKGTPKVISYTDEINIGLSILVNKYPNMSNVIEYLVKTIKLSCMKENGQISFKPILLVGGPGCGKTSFTSEVGMVLMGKPIMKIDLGNDVANFTLTGTDVSFSSAHPGKIVEAMFKSEDDECPVKNPVIHMDELDKANKEEKYSVIPVFYSLLEKNTARRFFDNFLGMNIDASGINYIFTANEIDSIPKPLLNRLKVFHIEDYTEKQFKECVIGSYYEKWLGFNNICREYVPAVLSDEVKDMVYDECKGDTRSIEDAFAVVFDRTVTKDQKTGHLLAFFSARELYEGWEKFRGRKALGTSRWRLPLQIRRGMEDLFDPLAFLSS